MQENKIGTALRFIGWGLMVVGAIAALIMGSDEELNWVFGDLVKPIAWGTFIQSMIMGTVFLGFSEVIRLLQGMQLQQSTQNGISDNNPINRTNEKEEFIEMERSVIGAVVTNSDITEFYKKKGLGVLKIVLTPYEDVYLVKTDGGRKIVELGGFTPQEWSEDKIAKDTQLLEWLKEQE